MNEIRQFLLSLPEEQLWIVGGVIAEVLLQVVKRYIWQPPDYKKVKKLLAAALVTFAIVLGTGVTGVGEFAAAWLATFVAAIGYHETTDKLGLKRLWANMASSG